MKLLLGLGLGYAGFLASQTLVMAIPMPMASHNMAAVSSTMDFNPPTPPTDPAPGGRVVGGAKRGSCQAAKQNLTALVPFTEEPRSVTNVWGLTVKARPTFWFYVPYAKNGNPPAIFKLQDQQLNPLYMKAIALPSSPGIMKVSLPDDAPELAVNKQYRWFLTFSCDKEEPSSQVYVEGVIKRVALSQKITKELETATPLQQFTIYAQNGIWHEAITTLAKMRQKSPEDTALEMKWEDLLFSIRLGNVATEPILSEEN